MLTQPDFHYSVDRAAGLITDAGCALRALRAVGLPHPHRHIVGRAIRKLESAQDDLYTARNDPWRKPKKAPAQLELL